MFLLLYRRCTTLVIDCIHEEFDNNFWFNRSFTNDASFMKSIDSEVIWYDIMVKFFSVSEFYFRYLLIQSNKIRHLTDRPIFQIKFWKVKCVLYQKFIRKNIQNSIILCTYTISYFLKLYMSELLQLAGMLEWIHICADKIVHEK